VKILITGANSPLGVAFSKKAREAGYYLIGSVRKWGGVIPNEYVDENIILDFENPGFSKCIPGELDCIVHIAAASEGTPEYLFHTNGIVTQILADHAIERNINKIIHISSMSIYGIPECDKVGSQTKIRHATPYGLSKWAGECFLHERAQHLNSVSIRSPAIVGCSARRNFLANLLSGMLSEKPYVELSNPNFLFNNLIHYDTFATFLLKLTKFDFTGHSYFPIAASQPIKLREVVDILVSRCRYQGRVVWKESFHTPFSIDLSDAMSFGFIPRTVLEELGSWLSRDRKDKAC
jgi:nucleoside-diphosphate-sugar epimerase